MSAAVRRAAVLPDPSPLLRARAAFQELVEWLFEPQALARPLDEVEREQEERGRELQRLLLQAHMDERGVGDVGPAIEVLTRDGGRTKVRRHGQRRLHDRTVRSVFGDVTIRRIAYHAKGAASVHPFDETAQLPARMFGYEVQRRAVLGALLGPFDESVDRVAESTGLTLAKRSVEHVLVDAALDFDAFYEGKNRALDRPSRTGSIVVAALDCKGVPMVRPETTLRTPRRQRGEHASKKRMATVAAVFTQAPRVRTPEEVHASLFSSGPRLKKAPRAPGPERKRVWASLEKSKDNVIAEVVREVDLRDPSGTKTRALVIDGERGLSMRAGQAVKGAVQILDLLHVMEKLWKAAHCFHADGSEEAEEWVSWRALQILRGKVDEVVTEVEGSIPTRMAALQRKAVKGAVAYLRNNRERMRYDDYLRRGLPIASGSVEGACKNLVKDRLERSGMRWTIRTAEAVLRLRAAYLSEDFDEYWRFHVAREQARLYQARRWRPVVEK